MKKRLRFTFIFLVLLNTIKVVIVVNEFLGHENHPDIHFGLLEKPNNLISLVKAIITIFFIGLLANLVKL